MMLNKSRRELVWLAFQTRIAVILLQALCNLVIPDHIADAFRSPVERKTISACDTAVELLFEGLTRWDGQYFLHIAKFGYTHESTLVFLPLYPTLVGGLASICHYFLYFAMTYHSLVILCGVFLNVLCFMLTAAVLYELSCSVLGNERLAYRSAVLFCCNPASIFFSALYSESLYALLAMYGMLCTEKKMFQSSLTFGLSSVARSNGIVNAGFIGHRQIKKWKLKDIPVTIMYGVLCLAPFLLYQLYCYKLFCHNGSGPDWCNNIVPVSYSHIQKHHWNVGFLAYYELKQIPNFILAVPVLVMFCTHIFKYLKMNWKHVLNLGVHADKQFPYIIHGLYLVVVCVLFVHIQVSTRLLASASPLLYWSATKMTARRGAKEKKIFLTSVVTFEGQNFKAKTTVLYFVSYAVVGTVLFSNYYPWT